MAFILSFGDTGPNTEVIDSGDRHFVRMGIGFDEVSGEIFSLTIALDFSIVIDGYELSFWISSINSDGLEEDFWDGSETRFIGPSERGLIRLALLLGVRVLAQRMRPKRVFVLSMQETLPPAAVQKYLEVNRVFHDLGYSVTECDPKYGNKCWILELSAVV